jgi:membrane dipeptidase
VVVDTPVSIPEELENSNRQQDDTSLIIHPLRRSSRVWNWRSTVGIAGLVVLFTPFTMVANSLILGEAPIDPSDYALRTRRILTSTPLIDGHNGLS